MSKKGRPRTRGGKVYERSNSKYVWVRYRDRSGRIVKESSGTTDWEVAERFLRDRLDARDEGRLDAMLSGKDLIFNEWSDWFLERRSKPPYRSDKTHQGNLEVLKNLRPVFGEMRLSDITSEQIEQYIEDRLRSERKVRTKLGISYRGRIKPATVHREYRVLCRILNVAVQQRRLTVNPCAGVEFPIRVSATTRKPHYMPASEQARIEFVAPDYLQDAIVILVEMGLRPYKELTPVRKEQVDLGNGILHIPDSKTASGVADMPMTELSQEAFRRRMKASEGSDYLFPTWRKGSKRPHLTTFKKIWASTLERAGIPHFSIYELRHTFATRLSAGGVADHFVTQMLRQGDSSVFKRYSQAKLGMMREALNRLDRNANEHEQSFGTAKPN